MRYVCIIIFSAINHSGLCLGSYLISNIKRTTSDTLGKISELPNVFYIAKNSLSLALLPGCG